MAASIEPVTAVGPLVPTSVVDVQIMYEGALPPPHFHRVTDIHGKGANLACSTGKSVSLWFAQHSDKELGLPPVTDIQALALAEIRDGFQTLPKEVLRQEDDSKKMFFGIHRRSDGDPGLGLGGLTVTYGSDKPTGMNFLAPCLHVTSCMQ
jgi:hypothetical protein